MNKIWIVVLIIVLAGGAWFLMRGDEAAAPVTETGGVTNTMPVPGSDAPEMLVDDADLNPAPANPGEKSFTVIGSNYKYDVKEIKVKKGDKVTITFRNSDGFHDWVIDEFNARTKQIQSPGEETISFVADKVGTFEYYCSVGKHRQNGMVGKLIVE